MESSKRLTLTLHQRQMLAIKSPATELLFGGGAGGGKLVSTRTPVMTILGAKPMGEIQVGDLLASPTGGATEVIALSEIETVPTYVLHFSDGTRAECCRRHLWAGWRNGQDRKYMGGHLSGEDSAQIWTAEEVKEITDKAKADQKARKRPTWFSIPLCKPLSFTRNRFQGDAYILGALLGDGCFSTRQMLGFTTSTEDWNEHWKYEFDYRGFQYSIYDRRETTIQVTFVGETRQKLRVWLCNLNLSGKKGAEKFVPESLLYTPIHIRREILRGLMDTDGFADERGYGEFCNISPNLSKSVEFLVRSLGGEATGSEKMGNYLDKEGNRVICQKVYRVHIRIPKDMCPFAMKRKAERFAGGVEKQSWSKTVIDVTIEEPQPMRCLQVRKLDGLYCINDCIVTHNSHLARVMAIKFCVEIPGFQAAIFRRTFRESQATFFEGPGSFPVLLAQAQEEGMCKIVKNEISFANGSRISTNHCAHANDRFAHQGAEFNLLILDEASTFTKEIYDYLRTRLRLGNLKIPERYANKLPMVLLTSNPGNIGHVFLKEGWVDNGPYKLVRAPSSEGGMLRQFIPSLYTDNFFAMQNDPTYRERLMGAGDPSTALALLEGDWSIVAGALFASVWSHSKHVIRSFPIPAGWAGDGMWRSADDGYANPAAVLWWAYDPIHDRFYVVSELYREGMLPDEMARRCMERDRQLLVKDPTGEVREHGKTLTGYIDPSSFSDTGTGAVARGNRMNALGCKWTPVEKAPGSRVWGIQQIHELLAIQPDGLPKLQIFDCCETLIKALPTAPRSDDNPEDLHPDFPQDHVIDSLRYGIVHRRKSFRKQRWAGH